MPKTSPTAKDALSWLTRCSDVGLRMMRFLPSMMPWLCSQDNIPTRGNAHRSRNDSIDAREPNQKTYPQQACNPTGRRSC